MKKTISKFAFLLVFLQVTGVMAGNTPPPPAPPPPPGLSIDTNIGVLIVLALSYSLFYLYQRKTAK